jgi:hypothetical protein
MRVTEVTVVAKYSLDTGHGWKAIEVGATATLTAEDETLETAQQELYNRLSHQLKVLWANGHGNGKPAQEQSQPETPEPPKEHWCSTHQTEYQRFSKDGKVWYSHKAPDGWCKEPGKK